LKNVAADWGDVVTIAQPASEQRRSILVVSRSAVAANPLFDAIVGAGAANNKGACMIAAQIEEDLICKGWPTGVLYGSEAQLVARFQVGNVVIREAVRILESRGTARMRRGPNGGLVVLAPTIAVLLEAIHRYVTSLRRTALQGHVCRSLLREVRTRIRVQEEAQSKSLLAGLIDELLAATDRFAECGPRGYVKRGAAAEMARSRAEQVFRLLMRDLAEEIAEDQRLGSELDLCQRYGADRSALRQAVRVLEFERIAVSTAGRGNGLMRRIPDPTAVCRLINCYFASARVSPGDAMNLYRLLSSEAVSIAARNASGADRMRLEAAQRDLMRSSPRVTSRLMQEAEDSQFDILDEPLVDLLLRGTKSYSTWSSSLRDPESVKVGEIYRAETLNVIAAILRQDPAGAASAQCVKVERLNKLILAGS
jgi:DNA-binding FadR family transcriptional regulator